jgi:mycothiol synthase
VTTPVLPAALTHRPMRPDDAECWAELLAAIEAADDRGVHYDTADCAEELAEPELDLGHDTVLVLDGGRAVAYQLLRLRARGEQRVLESDGGVHPLHRGRGIGTALVALAGRRAAELDAVGYFRVPAGVPDAVALLEDAGMVAVRWWSELLRDLAAPVTPVPVPDGLELHPLGPGFDAARWDEPLRAARNAAFADHWGSTPVSAEHWGHANTGTRAFRSECSAALTTPDGQVAGFVLGYEFDAATALTGRRDLYVGIIGTLAGWRGRGVAAALLAHVLRQAQEQGFVSSSLTVDAQNPTGALGVYERAGYVLDRREITFAPGT